VPTLTFSATAAAFRHLGAEIILVDIDPKSLTIDLEDAERKVTPHCKSIAPVHFGGWPCEMDGILAFARRRSLKVIEDAAHALPAHRNGRLIDASESDACVFSFYANKTITTGEGGMIATRNPIIYRDYFDLPFPGAAIWDQVRDRDGHDRRHRRRRIQSLGPAQDHLGHVVGRCRKLRRRSYAHMGAIAGDARRKRVTRRDGRGQCPETMNASRGQA
jgi:hypothetical protein